MCHSHNYSTCELSMAASVLQEWSWVVVTIRLTNPKILTTWLLTQKLCRPCWRLSSHSTYSRSNHFHHSYDPQVSRTLRSTQQMANWELHEDGTRDCESQWARNGAYFFCPQTVSSSCDSKFRKSTTVYSVTQTRNVGIIDSFSSLPHPSISIRNCRLHLFSTPQIYSLIAQTSTSLGHHHVLPALIQLSPNKDSRLQTCFIDLVLLTDQISEKCNFNHVTTLLITLQWFFIPLGIKSPYSTHHFIYPHSLIYTQKFWMSYALIKLIFFNKYTTACWNA